MSNVTTKVDNPAGLAGPIIPHIQLLDLHMVTFSSARFPALDTKRTYDQLFNPTQSIEISLSKKTKQFVAMIRVGVSCGEGKDKLVEFDALYRVIYKIKDTYSGDLFPERAEAFCRAHSLAHVWPYWREALASACARMQVPPILAPLLIVGSPSSRILKEQSAPLASRSLKAKSPKKKA